MNNNNNVNLVPYSPQLGLDWDWDWHCAIMLSLREASKIATSFIKFGETELSTYSSIMTILSRS